MLAHIIANERAHARYAFNLHSLHNYLSLVYLLILYKLPGFMVGIIGFLDSSVVRYSEEDKKKIMIRKSDLLQPSVEGVGDRTVVY